MEDSRRSDSSEVRRRIRRLPQLFRHRYYPHNQGILFNVGTQNEVEETAGSLSALETMVHIKPEFEDSIKN